MKIKGDNQDNSYQTGDFFRNKGSGGIGWNMKTGMGEENA
jgi:hypothetical protein